MTPACPREVDLLPLRDALIQHPGLRAVERCLALDGLKRALCPCDTVCDRWAAMIVEESRRQGEAIPRLGELCNG